LIKLLFCDSSESSFALGLGSLEFVLVKLFLLIKEGVMLDNVIDIVNFRVVFRFRYMLLLGRNIGSSLSRRHHHLKREVDT